MPEKDDHAGEVNQADIVFDVILVPNHQPTKVVEPCEQTLDFPSPLEATQRPAILSFALGSSAFAMRCNHLSTKSAEHFPIERIAVIRLVANEFFGNPGHKPLFQCLSHQLYFSWASTFCAYGERKTVAVRNRHEFAPLAPLGFSHAEPPFFAGT